MVAAMLVLLCTRPPEAAMFEQIPWLLTVPSIAIIGRESEASFVNRGVAWRPHLQLRCEEFRKTFKKENPNVKVVSASVSRYQDSESSVFVYDHCLSSDVLLIAVSSPTFFSSPNSTPLHRWCSLISQTLDDAPSSLSDALCYQPNGRISRRTHLSPEKNSLLLSSGH
ncbi:hypothetical protein L6452_40771 [Arctium lappa]|uniref:Uncharacterized protein n=1 Tax=Arctium lappa TaxID=4217 RepID=A0ACB8XP06_ARCLA|nr:hypothetical protein L6452_40771 [Arctium lappa]